MEYLIKLVLVLGVLCLVNFVKSARWSHSAMLSPDYRLLWSLGPGPQDITFELQVRTLGYVGFGFSKDGRMAGSDMVVGWVDQGQVYFQVSIFKLFVFKLLWLMWAWKLYRIPEVFQHTPSELYYRLNHCTSSHVLKKKRN